MHLFACVHVNAFIDVSVCGRCMHVHVRKRVSACIYSNDWGEFDKYSRKYCTQLERKKENPDS